MASEKKVVEWVLAKTERDLAQKNRRAVLHGRFSALWELDVWPDEALVRVRAQLADPDIASLGFTVLAESGALILLYDATRRVRGIVFSDGICREFARDGRVVRERSLAAVELAAPTLSPDMVHHVFAFLAVPSLLQARLVCRLWAAKGREDGLWAPLYQQPPDWREQPQRGEFMARAPEFAPRCIYANHQSPTISAHTQNGRRQFLGLLVSVLGADARSFLEPNRFWGMISRGPNKKKTKAYFYYFHLFAKEWQTTICLRHNDRAQRGPIRWGNSTVFLLNKGMLEWRPLPWHAVRGDFLGWVWRSHCNSLMLDWQPLEHGEREYYARLEHDRQNAAALGRRSAPTKRKRTDES